MPKIQDIAYAIRNRGDARQRPQFLLDQSGERIGQQA